MSLRDTMIGAFWSVAALVAGTAACNEDNPRAGPRAELLEKLQAAEANSANATRECSSYFYVRDHLSYFGVYTAAMVAVENQTPVLRRHWEGAAKWPNLQWSEGPREIGTHLDTGSSYSPVFPPSTLPELYAECRQILQMNPETVEVTLDIDQRGLPVTCSTWVTSDVLVEMEELLRRLLRWHLSALLRVRRARAL